MIITSWITQNSSISLNFILKFYTLPEKSELEPDFALPMPPLRPNYKLFNYYLAKSYPGASLPGGLSKSLFKLKRSNSIDPYCPQQVHVQPCVSPSSPGSSYNPCFVFMWATSANTSTSVQFSSVKYVPAMHFTYAEGPWHIPFIHRAIIPVETNTVYKYKITTENCSSQWFSIKSPPAHGEKPNPDKPIHIAIFGDQGIDAFLMGGKLVLDQVMRDNVDWQFDLNFILGDLSYATVWPNIKDFEIEFW